MTIRKGAEWGTLQPAPADLVTVTSDAELRSLVVAARSGGEALPAIGLLGGDLMRTVGGTAEASRFTSGEPVPNLPVDIVEVRADDGRTSCFVAHLVARRSWWRGPLTAAMNAQFLGTWDVAPRSHPNDGKVDVVTAAAELSLQQRWLARKRVLLGVHVPHPHITIRQQSTATLRFEHSTPVWLDGERWGNASTLELMVVADALVVCV